MKLCIKCNQKIIPYKMSDGSKRYAAGKRCHCFNCWPPGYKPIKKPRKLKPAIVTDTHKICPRCHLMLSLTEYYRIASDSKFYSWCKSCTRKIVVERQTKVKQQLVDYKGGKCSICGYARCLGALHFHHTEPEHKDFNLSKRRSTHFNNELRRELDKCILVCANCHSEIHAGILVR